MSILHPAADAQHHGPATGPRGELGPGPPVHAAAPSTTGGPTGPTTRAPAATACTKRTCGSSRASPTATPPRCWRRCSPPARSTAATAPAWTWSATTCPRWRSTGSRCRQPERYEQILDYLRRTPSARRGRLGRRRGQPPIQSSRLRLQLLDIANIRDIRLARKGLMGLPQHFLQDNVLARLDAAGEEGFERGVELALHTHVNHAQQLTPLVAQGRRALLDMGFRDVRNQGVLLRGVNDHREGPARALLHAAGPRARSCPYYFYMCDMIPNSEHWRVGVCGGAAAAARHHGLPAGLRHAAHRL